MIHRIRWSWTSYRGRPFATFLSFFFNISFLITFIGIIVLIAGISGHDLIATVVGGCIIALMVIYFYAYATYIKIVDKEIELQKKQFEHQKLIIQYQECKRKYPDFDINEETKNNKFAFLINSLGYSIVNAYEEIHNIKN